MAVRLDIRPRLDLRSAKPERRDAGGLRLAWGVSAYWVVGLSLAFAMHAGWLPVRDWLQVAWRQGPDASSAAPALLAPEEQPAPAKLVPPPAFTPDEIDEDEPDEADEPERDVDDASVATDAPAAEPPRASSDDETAARRAKRPASNKRRRTERARREPATPPPAETSLDDSERPARGRAHEKAKEKRRAAKTSSGRTASSGGGSSCEAAVAGYREEMKLGTGRPADLSSGQLGSVLNHGRYFAHCGVPPSTAVRICAAVQNGRAVGVTVSTDPPSGAVNRCVAGAVRGLSFPSHPLMDVTTTVFAADR